MIIWAAKSFTFRCTYLLNVLSESRNRATQLTDKYGYVEHRRMPLIRLESKRKQGLRDCNFDYFFLKNKDKFMRKLSVA